MFTGTYVKLVILLFLFSAAAGCFCQTAGEISVSVDPRIELMSTIFRLAGVKEYTVNFMPSYVDKVEEYFAPFRDHAAVRMAREVHRSAGVSYNAPMGLAVYLEDIHTLTPRVSFETAPADLDDRWTAENIPPFLEAARQFVTDTDFMTFFQKQQALYRTAVARMETVLADAEVQPWFTKYFGTQEIHFFLYLGLQNGGNCYSANVTPEDGSKEIHSVLGAWLRDDTGLPQFNAAVLPIMVHEFCHGYTNPIVDTWMNDLESSGKKIFPYVKKQMVDQAYSSWQTMMYESFVRACVIRWVEDAMGPLPASKQIAHDTSRGFYWTEDLSGLLKKFEGDRETYPDFNDFCPVIVEFFEEYSLKIGDVIKEHEEQRKKKAADRKADFFKK